MIEKSIGITGVESCAAVLPSLSIACQVIDKYPCPSGMTALAIVTTAVTVEKDFQKITEELFKSLESSGSMTIGLNDFLSAAANSHETFLYKLQQRMKSEIQN